MVQSKEIGQQNQHNNHWFKSARSETLRESTGWIGNKKKEREKVGEMEKGSERREK